MRVFPMDLWNRSIGNLKTIREIQEVPLISIIHVTVFYGLQEKILPLEVLQDLHRRYIAIQEKKEDHIINKDKL